jgi:hypothetical protein
LVLALLLAWHAGAAPAAELPEASSPVAIILGDPPVAPKPLELAQQLLAADAFRARYAEPPIVTESPSWR